MERFLASCRPVFFLIFLFICKIGALSAQITKPKPPVSAATDVVTPKAGATTAAAVEIADEEAFKPHPIDTTRNLSVITFGSCNKLDKPQMMWDAVAANNPNLWIWLGDITNA